MKTCTISVSARGSTHSSLSPFSESHYNCRMKKLKHPFDPLPFLLMLWLGFSLQNAWAGSTSPLQGYFRTGDYSAAYEKLQEIMAGGDVSDAVHLQYVLTSLLVGKTQEAETLLAKLPESAETSYLEAVVASKSAQWYRSQQALTKALASNAQEPKFFASLGLVNSELGDEAGALEACRKAVSLAPTESVYSMVSGLVLSQFGQRDEAKKTIRSTMTTTSPPTADARIFEKLWGLQERFNAQLSLYETKQLQKPGDTKLASYLAFLAMLSGKLDYAASLYQNILKQDPNHAEAAFQLGGLLLLRGDSAQSHSLFTKAATLEPDNPRYLRMYGVSCGLNGELGKAISILEEAVKLDSLDAEAWCNLGVFEAYQKKFDAAIGHYRKALELNPHYIDAHVNLGIILGKQEHLKEAISEFTEALKLDPQHIKARKFLGLTYVEAGKFKDALECFKAVEDAETQDVGLMHSAMKAAEALGLPQEKIRWARKLLKINSEDAATRLQLAQSLVSLKQTQEAIDELIDWLS